MYEMLTIVGRALNTITGTPVESIRPDTDIRGLKFAQLATLLMACERHYRINISDEQAVAFTCVQDVIDCIKKELADGKADYVAPTDEDRTSWYYE